MSDNFGKTTNFSKIITQMEKFIVFPKFLLKLFRRVMTQIKNESK
jgi:hypothetical protein